MELTQEQIDALEAFFMLELKRANQASWTYDSLTVRERAESMRGKVEAVLNNRT
jgi:hypothetical protein